MLKKTTIMLVLLVGFLMVFSAGLSIAADTTIKLRMDQDIEIFDPGRFTSTATSPVIRIVYDTLVDYPPGDWPNLKPEVAENYEISKDGLTYRFYLKKGVKFHKGYGEVTSEDVKFSVERVMDPNTKAPYKNAFSEVVEGIDTPDKYTVVFRLKKPDPAFLAKLAPWRPGAILSMKAVKKFGDDYGKSAEATVGCGPFELVSWVPKERAVFNRFEEYHGAKPFLQRIEMPVITDETTAVLALQKGELDICPIRVGENLPIVEADKNLKVYMCPSGHMICGIGFNVQDPLFKDVRIRRALTYAIDKDAAAGSIMGRLGTRACGLMAPGAYFGALDCKELDLYPYNPQKAKELLAEAGYAKGLKVKYTGVTLKPWQEVGVIAQAYWKEVGVDAEIEDLPIKDWIARIYKAEERVFEIGVGTRPPEPSILLSNILHSGSSRPGMNGMNYTGVDDLLGKALVTIDPEERKNIYHHIQKKVAEDCIIIPLIYETNTLVVRKNIDLGRGAKGNQLTCPYNQWYWVEDIKKQ
jgi:peptide/nickel transport system substrate-binding protein